MTRLLGTREDSVNSVFGIVPPGLAMTQSLQLLVPCGLAMTTPSVITVLGIVPSGLAMTRSLQLLLPWGLARTRHSKTSENSAISASDTLGAREYSVISASGATRIREDLIIFVISASGAVRIREDSATSASGIPGTREDSTVSAFLTLGAREDSSHLSVWYPGDAVGTLGTQYLKKKIGLASR